ncbi:MAG: Holliday junction resolvase RuvX [Pyrinomonadaceae bacterium]
MLKEQRQSDGDKHLTGRGRLVALDLGAKRTGVAVCDELQLSVRPLAALGGSEHRDFVTWVIALMEIYRPQALIIGLPLRLDGSDGDAARRVRGLARQLELTLNLPVLLQDERLTSVEAEETLRSRGHRTHQQRRHLIDSEAAALVLRDFIQTSS